MSIHIRDLHKSFGPKVVLAGVSLDVHDGETLAVIGQSGTGKSVLLKHIVRLLEPDRGTIEVDAPPGGGARFRIVLPAGPEEL